jgi:predicted amidophosphoribosyltransferase
MVDSTAESCKNRHCGSCATWKRLPLIRNDQYSWPHRLDGNLREFVPAYWVIPSRCYLNYERQVIALSVRQSSNLFYRFKTGIANLAFPLALGLYRSLQKRHLLDVEAIVPIPLSPDKAEAGEINRTALLAREMEVLLGTPIVDALSLNQPISKHKLRTWAGLSAKEFERRYRQALVVSPDIRNWKRILLLDDVCTEGSTLRVAAQCIRELNLECEIIAVAAGQMIVKPVVRDKAPLVG